MAINVRTNNVRTKTATICLQIENLKAEKKIEKKFEVARNNKEKTPKFSSRRHNRCKICGRPRAYLRKFGLCRLCFRGLALRGEIPGVAKSSW